MKTGNKILIEYGLKKELLSLGSYPTIDKALDGDCRTPQKLNIRYKAIELGGIEIKNNHEDTTGFLRTDIERTAQR